MFNSCQASDRVSCPCQLFLFMFQEKLLLPLQKQWRRKVEKVIPPLFGSSVILYIPFSPSWGFSEVLPIKKKKKSKWRWHGKTFLRLAPHRTCMVKRLVRASSLSVRLRYSQFFSALKAVKPVNPFLPSCSGAEQHHADSCIWQVRGLALQKELCKQRHLLPQYSPASSSSLPASLHEGAQGTATLWISNTEATVQQSFLCSTSRSTHTMAFLLPGTTLPLLWGREHKHQAALAPRQAAPGKAEGSWFLVLRVKHNSLTPSTQG